MKKWRCTVCGYIHEGETPPEKCPLCGATADKFVEVAQDPVEQSAPAPKSQSSTKVEQEAAQKTDRPQGAPNLLTQFIIKFHGHPISAHTPLGLIPVSVFFVALAILFNLEPFGVAAYYNLVVAALALPVVMLTGYLEWKHRYQSARTLIFITKILCSVIVVLSLAVLLVWPVVDTDLVGGGSARQGGYMVVILIATAAALLAGHMGSKLVYAGRDSDSTS